VITSPEGGPLSRTVLDGTGGRSWDWDRPGVAREPWLLDRTRFCSGSGGGAVVGASSSSSAIPLLTLLPRGDDGEEEEEDDENEGLGETARRLLDRNLSRLWPRRRNPPTITGACEEKPCTRAPTHGRAPIDVDAVTREQVEIETTLCDELAGRMHGLPAGARRTTGWVVRG